MSNAVTTTNAGARPPLAVLRASPVDPVRAAPRQGERLIDAASRDDGAAPAAQTRRAAGVHPTQPGHDAAWLDARAAGFLAQRIAQELMPEEPAETASARRAGYAAYAAATGQSVTVLGPAYAGIGFSV